MKYFKYLIIIFFFGCNARNQQTLEFTSTDLSDSIWVDLNLYSPHNKLHGLLDSIITTLDNCPSPADGDIIEFVISIETEDYGFMMDIATISDYHWNYSLSSGLFDYKGYRFYGSGLHLGSLFFETDSSLRMRIQNPKKMIFDIDDRGYQWGYAIKDGSIEGILVKDCQRVWVNGDYFPGEG